MHMKEAIKPKRAWPGLLRIGRRGQPKDLRIKKMSTSCHRFLSAIALPCLAMHRYWNLKGPGPTLQHKLYPVAVWGLLWGTLLEWKGTRVILQMSLPTTRSQFTLNLLGHIVAQGPDARDVIIVPNDTPRKEPVDMKKDQAHPSNRYHPRTMMGQLIHKRTISL